MTDREIEYLKKLIESGSIFWKSFFGFHYYRKVKEVTADDAILEDGQAISLNKEKLENFFFSEKFSPVFVDIIN